MSLRTLHVRAQGDPAALAPRLEREIKELAPDMPIADLRTMSQSLEGIFGYLIFRVGAIQASGMGVLGLVLAIVGVYGVVSFGASLRTREIGIRVALGAQPRDVLRLILGQGLAARGDWHPGGPRSGRRRWAACCRAFSRSSTPPTGGRSPASRPDSRRSRSWHATFLHAGRRACR